MNQADKISNKYYKKNDFSKTKKKNNKWTLLFVGDNGKIITVRNFVRIIITVLIALIIAVSTAAFFIVGYNSFKNKNSNLLAALQIAQTKVLSLQKEKDLLMVRLVVAEEKNKSLTSKTKTVKKK